MECRVMYVLPEQRKKLAQLQAQLQYRETLVKIKESKARISNFIRIGEIMERCKISTLDHKVLAGGFLHIYEALKDQKTTANWAERGLPYLAKPEKPKKEPPALEVVFKKLPPEEIRKALWERGFTCETTNHIWEGKAVRKEIIELVGKHGNVYRVRTSGFDQYSFSSKVI